MLAQISDIFNTPTFFVIMFFMFQGAPVLGFIIGWVLRGNRYLETRWKWIAGYYGLALILLVFAEAKSSVTGQQSSLLTFFLFGVMFCGPILGVVLSVIPAKGPRYPEGHCQTCGYNLTGNVSGRCSECGTDVNHYAEQEILERQRARARVPWLLGGISAIMLITLPLANESKSLFLIGFWALVLVILLPVTILLFLRRT